MKYFIRACKYVVYFAVLFCILTAIIWLLSPEKANGVPITSLFKAGSLKHIIILFVAISALYPFISFKKRNVHLEDGFETKRDTVMTLFDDFGMEVESESENRICFRMKSRGMRFSRMWEDRITMDIHGNTLEFEGYRRDLDRLIRALNYRLAPREE